jgi:hypothetical protein
VREIRSLRAMWRALETGSSLKIYAPALDPTGYGLPVLRPSADSPCENLNAMKRSIAIEMLTDKIAAVSRPHPARIAIDGVDRGLARQHWQMNSSNQL